jgi:hypothetical protein
MKLNETHQKCVKEEMESVTNDQKADENVR